METREARRLLDLSMDGILTDDEIRKAYRTATKSAHPDAGGSQQAMIDVTEARDTLLRNPDPPRQRGSFRGNPWESGLFDDGPPADWFRHASARAQQDWETRRAAESMAERLREMRMAGTGFDRTTRSVNDVADALRGFDDILGDIRQKMSPVIEHDQATGVIEIKNLQPTWNVRIEPGPISRPATARGPATVNGITILNDEGQPLTVIVKHR